jgi:hypothetical protein
MGQARDVGRNAVCRRLNEGRIQAVLSQPRMDRGRAEDEETRGGTESESGVSIASEKTIREERKRFVGLNLALQRLWQTEKRLQMD